MPEKPLRAVFPECPPPDGGPEPLVRAVRLSKDRQTMTLELTDVPGGIAAPWMESVKAHIKEYYGLADVTVSVVRPQTPASAPAAKAAPRQPAAPGVKGGAPLFGRPSAKEPMDMDLLPREEAAVCVRGRIFKMEETREHRTKRFEQSRTIRIMEFYMTDNAGAVKVRLILEKNRPNEKIEAELESLFKKGEWVTVWGKLEEETFREKTEWVLSAKGAAKAERPLRQDNAPVKRVELHLHTQMSDKDATTPIKAALATAARWGHPAMAVTDHGVCHAFPDAMHAAKGIKVLYGCEGYLPPLEGEKRNYHIVLIAKNQTGLKNLYRLTSLAHVEHFHGRPLIPRDLLTRYREGIIVGGACESGEIFRSLVRRAPWEQTREIAKFYDYLEIQPLCNNAFLIRDGEAADEEQLRDWNRDVLRLGDELGKPVCATGDVHFLEPEDEVFRKILLNTMNMDVSAPLPLYFKTTDEMLEEFSYLGEERAFEVVVTNTRAIADMCEDVRPVRAGEYFPRIEGSAEELRRLSTTRAAQLYGQNLPEVLAERLDTELNSIIKKGYDIIYMIAQKLVQRSLAEGYLVGSRGSVGSSIVAYLAGITEVNALPPHYRCPNCLRSEFPSAEERGGAGCGADMQDKNCPHCGTAYIKDGFNIPFATFLGFEADKKPDIDLNFSGEYQARAHAHTVELFGQDNVFRAGTISTIAEKTAIGYSLKYAETQGLDLSNAELMRLGQGCVGTRTTTGQHPGGLIVLPSENDIYDFCPVQYSANKKGGMICTHFDYHAIEENLLKLDLLGHDSPTFIKHLESMTGVDAMSIPLDDKETMSLFTSSKALGFENDKLLGPTGAVAIPEFGTRNTRAMLVATNPTTFEELVRISGLSHGENVWQGNAEPLVSSGKATLREVICARDDIMLYLISKGLPGKLSFTIMESVRKGKGLKSEWEAEMRKLDLPPWYIDSCNLIAYMFPKAHAVAYVMMSFRIAWFKLHHPMAFYAAYFSLNTDKFDALTCSKGIDEVKSRKEAIERNKEATASDADKAVVLEICYEFLRRGMRFAPPDIYESDAARFLPSEKGLMIPLSALSGVGAAAAESVVKARADGPFISEEDVLARSRLSRANVDVMRELGALGGMPASTQLSLFEM